MIVKLLHMVFFEANVAVVNVCLVCLCDGLVPTLWDAIFYIKTKV